MDSWKNPRTRTQTRFRIPDEGIINLYTPAIEHSACPLVGGKCGDDARLRRSFLARTDATQPQANAPCARQQCRVDTLASGHIGQLAATGSRRTLQHCTVRSAPRPLNNVLPLSTPGVKRRRTQRNARNKWPTTWLESVRGHGCVKPETFLRPRMACANPDYGATRRHTPHTRTSGDASTRRNASRRTPTQDAAQCQKYTPPTVTRFAATPDGRRHADASTASDNYLTDQTVERGSSQTVSGGGVSV